MGVDQLHGNSTTYGKIMTGFQSKKKMGLSRMGDEFNVQQSPTSEQWNLKRAQNWKLKLCWTPKNCYISGKPLWGKQAYYGERWITGPGEPVYEGYWVEKSEFIFWTLKGRE